MREIIPNRLWTGNIRDAEDISGLLDMGIEAVVDLALNEKPTLVNREVIYCRFPLIDGGDNSPGLLRLAVDTVASLISREIATLVYCSNGMSRSVAVVALALALNQGESADETLVKLASSQPHDVTPLLWSELGKACRQAFDQRVSGEQ